MCSKCGYNWHEDPEEEKRNLKKLEELENQSHDAPPEPGVVSKILRILIVPFKPFYGPVLDKVAMWGFQRVMVQMMDGKIPPTMQFNAGGKSLGLQGAKISPNMLGMLIDPSQLKPPSNMNIDDEEEEEEEEQVKKPTRRPKSREDKVSMLNKLLEQ